MKAILLASSMFALVVVVTSLTAASGFSPPGAAAPRQSPSGSGHDAFVRVCADCHGLDVVEGQRRTRAQWRDVVEDMIGRGGNASDEDARTIINYLATTLGRVNVNRASESDMQTVLELSGAEAAAIVNYRTSSGEFKNLDDLKKVAGLDFSKVETKKDRIVFSGQ